MDNNENLKERRLEDIITRLSRVIAIWEKLHCENCHPLVLCCNCQGWTIIQSLLQTQNEALAIKLNYQGLSSENFSEN